MRRHWGILAAILGLGLVLRIIAIDSRGIWYDDAFSIFLAERSLGEIVRGTAADTMPPLYYFLLHAWMAAGTHIAWIRLLNIFLSAGIVFLLYLTGSEVGGRRAGYAAAFLGAISPLQIYHAQEVRMYSLLAFTQLAYAWFFLRIWRSQEGGKTSPWMWAGLIISGTAAMYSHNLAAFGLVVPTLFLLLARRWRLLLKVLLAQAAIGMLTLPWLLLVPGQIDKIQRAFWTPRPGIVELFQALILTSGNLPLPPVWMALALFLSLAILIILLMEARRWRQTERDFSLLAAWIVLPPVLLFAVSYLMRPVFVPRGFIISLLAYLVLAGVVIARSWKPGAGVILAGAFAVAALVSLPYQYSYDGFPRSPYPQAAAYLNTVVQPGDRVIHDNKLTYFPMAYYAPDLPQAFLADEPGSHNDSLAFATQAALNLYAEPDIIYAAAQSGKVYFIVFTKTIEEYQAGGLDDHPTLAWLKAAYPFLERQLFGDLEVYEFARVK
jgi:mannosyltransferase